MICKCNYNCATGTNMTMNDFAKEARSIKKQQVLNALKSQGVVFSIAKKEKQLEIVAKEKQIKFI